MKDYLIVGFGLAGLSIAEELQNRCKSFHVFEGSGQTASKVAGGIINPLILKRFTKSWMADELIPEAELFYKQIEKRLKISILQHLPIYRKIKSPEEQNNWYAATDNPDVQEFMDDRLINLPTPHSRYQYGRVKHTSLVNTSKLLESYGEYLFHRNQISFEEFDYSQLKGHKTYISYKNHKARKIVFCEGIGLQKNPFFPQSPLVGNKGEYLIIKAPQLSPDFILKAAIAIIPLGREYYKVGATYSRKYQDTAPTEHSKRFLTQKLEEIIDVPYEFISMEVGVRPTVLDRRPLLGAHPAHSHILICNGFGSHGLMIAPTAAHWLLDFDLNRKSLPREVNIHRYFKN